MKLKKITKRLTTFSLAAALSVTSAFAFPMLPAKAASAGETFTNPNNGASYQWQTNESGQLVLYKDGALDSNEFVSDGSYTYYCQADGTVMKDKLTYHPDGQHVIYFDADGHEVFNSFTHISVSISGQAVDDQCYFNMSGYMYVNTVTYDVTGTKLYYINPYGQMEHSGWFKFDPNAGYGDTGKWTFTGDSYMGYANYDGTLVTNQASYDQYGNPIYFQGNGECKSMNATPTTPVETAPNITISEPVYTAYEDGWGYSYLSWAAKVSNSGSAAGSAEIYVVVYGTDGSVLKDETFKCADVAVGTTLMIGDELYIGSDTPVSNVTVTLVNQKKYSGNATPMDPGSLVEITKIGEGDSGTYKYMVKNITDKKISGQAIIVLYKNGKVVAADNGESYYDLKPGVTETSTSYSRGIYHVDHDDFQVFWLPTK